MKYKNLHWGLLTRILLLLVTLTLIALLLVTGLLLYLILVVPILAYQVVEFYHFHRKAFLELDQFVEAIHYRDFSTNFDEKHAPLELLPLRKGFNQINSTFKTISKEKETQYQYLQKILELVDTGILSYKSLTGEVVLDE